MRPWVFSSIPRGLRAEEVMDRGEAQCPKNDAETYDDDKGGVVCQQGVGQALRHQAESSIGEC